MRIAICGQTYFPGNNGQAIFTIHLAEGLARAGHEVHVIVPHGHFQYQHEIVNGVHLHLMGSINFDWIHPGVYFTFLPVQKVREIFKAFRPDVVHIQDHYFLSRDVARVARQMNIPILGTNHFLPENLLPYLRHLPVQRALKISVLWNLMLQTYNRLDMITTPTETAAKILLEQKVRVSVKPVSCGVDTCHFEPAVTTLQGLIKEPNGQFDRSAACELFGLDPEKVLFLYVGRLDGEKRIDLLLRGLALLRDQGREDIDLAIAGQGAARDELVNLAHDLRLDERVRFLGYVPNEHLPLLYQAGQLFAMPSPEELQSIATLEAMATGLPILAANARALPELVTHEINGYLFEPGQTEAAACGMAYLADHREEWQRMGWASRKRAVAHSLENTIQRYEAIYNSLCEERRHPTESSQSTTR